MTKSDAKYWNLRALDSEAVDSLAVDLNETQLLTSVLYNRGIRTPKDAEAFLHPSMQNIADSFLMLNMSAVVDSILESLLANETILVFGDNDVDGVTSTTLVYQFLTHLGANAHYFLPRRKEDGHGFNDDTITAALNSCQPNLVITVDCGTSGVSEIAALRAQGIKVIVVDHHAPPEVMPDTLILNPKQPGETFPYDNLAAVGVAFHLVAALVQTCRERNLWLHFGVNEPDLQDMLDLVCLGTIADVVPLLGENRTFVSLGLDVIRKRKRSGIAALLSDVGADDKYITERTICYRLVPRINAAGRVGDPNECVALLTAYRYTTAQAIARSLENYNHQRQNAEASMINEAIAIAQQQVLEGRRVLVVARENWHQGILGIISSRILDKFYKPTVVIAINDGRGRGSARSPEGFSILNAFAKCKELIDDFGGHHSAAGLSLLAENVEAFSNKIERVAGELLAGGSTPIRSLDIDAEANIAELLSLWQNQYLEWLGPFGTANKEPTFIIKAVRVMLIKRLNHAYARAKVRQDTATLALHVPSALTSDIKQGDLLDVVVTPKYAPHRDFPEFILLAAQPASTTSDTST
ncbi:MAG: single-stranded-DNA-specific exonuclease RecJ [Proteobacteria bacterium]|nr:single-stranded-DNA-specific exonuclease RecJ [Pseudomonadota bacterium]